MLYNVVQIFPSNTEFLKALATNHFTAVLIFGALKPGDLGTTKRFKLYM